MDAGTERLIEKVGLRFVADGLPPTAGRILSYLLLSPEARSLDELAAGLQVSKAGVSSNARLLEAIGVIGRAARPGDRRGYYRVSEDLHLRLLKHCVRSLQDTELLLAGALDEAEVAGDAVVRDRLRMFTAFFRHVLAEIQGAGDRWASPETPVGSRVAGAGRGRRDGQSAVGRRVQGSGVAVGKNGRGRP